MFHERSIKEKLIKGGAWAFFGKLAAAFAGLVVNALLARLLTLEEMGAYFLIFSLVSVAAIIAQVGMTQTVVKLIAESMATDRPGRGRQTVVLALRIVGVGGVAVACFLAFGAAQWLSQNLFNSRAMASVGGLVALWALILSVQQLLAEIYRGFHDIRLATIFGGLATSVLSMFLFLILWLVSGQSNLEHILMLTLGAGFSSVLFSSLFLWTKLAKLPLSEGSSMTLLRDIRDTAWPIFLINLFYVVLLQADLWIVGLYSTQDEVALYGVAARTVSMVVLPLMIINAVLPPVIAEMFAKGRLEELEVNLRVLATYAGIPSIVLLGAFVFFGDIILAMLFGASYQEAAIILAMLSLGQLANVWAGSNGLVLINTGQQLTMMFISLGTGLLMVSLAYLVVGSYGGVGVAASAAFALCLQNLIMLIVVKQRVGVWTHMSPKFFYRVFQRPAR